MRTSVSSNCCARSCSSDGPGCSASSLGPCARSRAAASADESPRDAETPSRASQSATERAHAGKPSASGTGGAASPMVAPLLFFFSGARSPAAEPVGGAAPAAGLAFTESGVPAAAAKAGSRRILPFFLLPRVGVGVRGPECGHGTNEPGRNASGPGHTDGHGSIDRARGAAEFPESRRLHGTVPARRRRRKDDGRRRLLGGPRSSGRPANWW